MKIIDKKPDASWADTLRELRGDRTREEISDLLAGCPVNTIRNWEQGVRTPPEWQQYVYAGWISNSDIRSKKAAK